MDTKTAAVNYHHVAELAESARRDALAGNALGQLDHAGLIIWQTERLIRSAVEAAREDGASWEQIGKALDISRQAAWERYGKAR